MTLKGLKSKISKYRILTVIIVSYLLVISLFVASFVAIYFYSQDTFRAYFDNNSKIIAENISEKYDENIENINNMVVNSILTDEEIKKDVQELQSGSSSVECLWSVRKQLEQKLYDTKYLDEVLIYVESRDMVIFSTGFCFTKQYYDAYAKDNFSEYEEFLSFLDGEEMPKKLYSQETMQMFSRKQYYLYKEDVAIGKIILRNDMEGFLGDFVDEYSDVVILENEYVLASSDGNLASVLARTKDDSGETVELDGKYVYCSNTGDGRRVSYYIVDMAKINEANKTYRLFIIGASLLCLLMCAVVCIFFTRVHYSPIKNFVKFISEKNKGNNSGFDYSAFSDAIDYIESNEKSTVEKEQNLREVRLEQWLLYKQNVSREMLKIEPWTNSALIVVRAEDYDKIFFEEVYEKKSVKIEMANCILSNILDEEFHNAFPDVIKCKINDLLVWMVSFNEQSEWRTTVNEITKRTLNLSREEFNISFEYYTGASCETIEKLSEDFDLLMIEIKQDNKNTEQNMDLGRRQGENHIYYFPETLKRQLYDSIEEGNSKGALMIADNILEYNINVLHCELNNLKALATEMCNTVTYKLRGFDVAIEKLFEENRLGKGIIMCEQIEELKSELKKFIESMCGVFYSKVNSDDSIYAKTRRFVYQNYKDPLLSSVTIADELGLSRDYFLSVFKKESGIKVADYIHQIRIEEACKLLGKTNLSIEKIAKQVGYSNTKTFSRVFVKLKGVTPGVYRDQLG